MCYVYSVRGRLFSPDFQVAMCSGDMGQPEDLPSGGHISSGLLGKALMGGAYRRDTEAKLFAVLWALWLCHYKVIFKGRAAFVDHVIHNMEDLVSWWIRRA